MALKSVIVCLFISANICSASYVPPKIIDVDKTNDTILNAGENYNLTCQGSEPLTWTYPKVTEEKSEKNSWTSFEVVSSVVPHNNDYIYRSVLHITNISYPFVGYYTCLYETNNDNDQIYLYVNDPEHLSIEDTYKIHYAAQYQETTIPCRPTSPDVEVELISFGTDQIDQVYDPKTGFTFIVKDISFEDTYSCRFIKDKIESEFLIFLKINPSRPFLATPYIEDESHNHTDVGQTLNLKCVLQENSGNIRFDWKTPRGTFTVTPRKNKENVKVDYSQQQKPYLISNLHVYDATQKDAGSYACMVSDRQNHKSSSKAYIMVHDVYTCFIDIREENDQGNIEVEAGGEVQWILEVDAHPIPELSWFDNKGNEVKNDTRYHSEFASGKAVFKINNVSLDNDGLYKVRGISSRTTKTPSCPKTTEYELSLTVYDKPAVCLESRKNCKDKTNQSAKIYLLNETVDLECRAKGNPLPIIIWEYKKCLEEDCKFYEVKEINGSTQKFVRTSFLRLNTTQEGIVRCSAFNALGNDTMNMTYYLSNIRDGFDILNFDEDAIVTKNKTTTAVIVATGNTLTFTCAVSPRRSDYVEVFYNNKLLNEDYVRNYAKDEMSHNTTISLHQANSSDSGVYSCRIRNLKNNQLKYEYKNVTIAVKEPVLPTIWATNLNEKILVDYPNMPYKLYCNYSGIPKATVEWFKDEVRILPSKRIILEENDSILKFVKTAVSDEGLYRCLVTNTVGIVSKEATLKFKVKPVSVAIYLYITGAIGLLLLAAIIYIIVKIRKERALRRELKLLGLENFHNGNPENLNPELGIDDQAELLPYNKKWEFPIEHLELGKQLGSGAFGVVMKAKAKGIIDGKEISTVAVKMVKKNADQSYIKALASELKIMVHLGKHINVVNLLGACTKNVAKRELLVIVEYCRFGNLQNYLFKHRASYINQVDQVSGKIDYDIGTDILERSYSVSSENTNYTHTAHSMQDYRGRRDTVNSNATQLTSMGDETVILSNNSAGQPEWRVNYRGDYKGHVKPVCTGDLVVWSFQVARGMEYLASRKVLHGDLAARNILLSDNNVVKICDFGLAKTMYNDNNYKKKGNSPLPIKWMAIESIRDRVFSTQSDVWSFGIVLWELFSLARTPYPGMEADERLFYKLVEGYRMESPLYAPKAMYQIMLDCWHSKPLARPSFTKLVERIGTLLEESVHKHYIDLNDPYLKMNTEKLQESDYLAMLSPPSFDVLSTPPPLYVNDIHRKSPNERQSTESGLDGYTFMGTNEIFSPRLHEDEVFDFSTGKRTGTNLKKENHELRPMLHSYNNESDSETGYLTPITPLNSVSNPSYHIPPAVLENNPPKVRKEPVKPPDNYITMPQYKNLISSNFKDSVNDSVKLDDEKNKTNVQYVNSDAEMWNSIDV